MQIFIIVALLIAILAVTFALQNPVVLTIHFLAWTFEGSLALILLGTFALGFLSSFLLSLASVIQKRFKKSSGPPPDPPAPAN